MQAVQGNVVTNSSPDHTAPQAAAERERACRPMQHSGAYAACGLTAACCPFTALHTQQLLLTCCR